mmetsp:Transcript_47248/g.115054  ORF Transcript_47248/g.115054 Transcript_47248/m.115054 type:complete len:206 (-) Transcript_47248:625-1242(-)
MCMCVCVYVSVFVSCVSVCSVCVTNVTHFGNVINGGHHRSWPRRPPRSRAHSDILASSTDDGPSSSQVRGEVGHVGRLAHGRAVLLLVLDHQPHLQLLRAALRVGHVHGLGDRPPARAQRAARRGPNDELQVLGHSDLAVEVREGLRRGVFEGSHDGSREARRVGLLKVEQDLDPLAVISRERSVARLVILLVVVVVGHVDAMLL